MIQECMNDSVMQEDIEAIVQDSNLVEKLKNTYILVTGATGLIGSQIVKTLMCMNRLKNANIHVIALSRSIERAEKIFGDLIKREEFILYIADVNHKLEIGVPVDYIIHGASATNSRYFVTNPVETIKTAIDGTSNVLEIAKEKQVKAFVYLSSLEVYGTVSENMGLISEDHYGYIDPLSVRSSYSEGKRMVECLCISYGTEYNIPVKIARLSQTFGAGVEYNDGRVFAEFARCVLENRDIVLHTMGRTVRTYCYTKDAISALLYILTKGEQGKAYNVTNMDTAVSIREMAEIVCDLYPESKSKVIYDIPENIDSFGYNPEMVIKLDSTKLMNLGWEPTVDLEHMYRRMIKSMYRNTMKK